MLGTTHERDNKRLLNYIKIPEGKEVERTSTDGAIG
jgi:hypothetical protein